MKKVLMVCVAFALSVAAINQSQAQTKIGSFDEESVLGLMPGIQKIDTLLRKYVVDSLNPQRDYQMSELKRKDSTYRADSAKMSGSLRDIMQKEISQHFYTVQNWQQIQNENVQSKQDELLAPFRQRIYGALQEIITSEKYTYILKSDAFFPLTPAPICDNLSLKVAMKLKLAVPKEAADAFKAANCGGAAGTGPVKPAPKVPGKN